MQLRDYRFTILRKPLMLLLCIGCFSLNLFSQYDHIDVFPGLEGSALLNNVQAGFTPLDLLTWSDTRDTMFSEVWGVNDSLSCIYSGHTLYMNPNEDPTQTVFLNGINSGINTEHVYPQSKGASEGNARINMHNLFPSRVDVNSTRGSFPYGEVNDNVTTSWFYQGINQNSIPQNNIDAYSEFGNGVFEPRESVKGDIARTVMYFYTIYRDKADAADPEFFGLQQEYMCDWHFADPVDQKEWEGNLKIASYQDGLSNPFVLDCSLAARMYCDKISEACQSTSVNENYLDISQIKIYPNPAYQKLQIEINSSLDIKSILLFDTHSRLLRNIEKSTQSVDLSDFKSGIYLLRFEDEGGHVAYHKFVIQ